MSDHSATQVSADASGPELSVPDRKLVEHVMREVSYADRLVLYRMTVGLGTTTVAVYTFAELVATVFGTQWDRLGVEGSKASLMWVDPPTLTAWVRDVLGDPELADALTGALEGADHYRAQIDAIYPVFAERARQYLAVRAEMGDGD